MVTDRFGALIEELSTAMKIKLVPDSHNACRIRFKDKLEVYMEPDTSGEVLQVLIDIGKPGEGRFRENLLREALRANGLPSPRIGTFCYGQKSDSLLLFDFLPMEDLNGTRLTDIILQLSEKSRLWRDSIARGEIPPFQSGKPGQRPEGVFGLR
jgi:hypothetical protein